jgi:hypothetical protein
MTRQRLASQVMLIAMFHHLTRFFTRFLEHAPHECLPMSFSYPPQQTNRALSHVGNHGITNLIFPSYDLFLHDHHHVAVGRLTDCSCISPSGSKQK